MPRVLKPNSSPLPAGQRTGLGLAPSHQRSGIDSSGGKDRRATNGLELKEEEEEEDQELASRHPSASQWHPIVFHLASSVCLPPGDTRNGRRRGQRHTRIRTRAHTVFARRVSRDTTHWRGGRHSVSRGGRSSARNRKSEIKTTHTQHGTREAGNNDSVRHGIPPPPSPSRPRAKANQSKPPEPNLPANPISCLGVSQRPDD